ncbi:facilitated trehalose transporter Tret1-like [Copidosoma floridanum]|uniref:facilitated trehalose transporter Tret1-like n=1 Tax=Copidosoma floridanum TaxID=29053 RepID=UPI0006C96D6D|nr:facilitated trehalose transporter Tret1-like [Copidosoma floridanum]
MGRNNTVVYVSPVVDTKMQKMILPQWLAGIGVFLLLIHVGLMGGWASPTLARLAAPDSPMPISPEQASWVASIINFGRFFGGVLGPLSASLLGSKSSILLTVVPIAVGWLSITLATSIEWLIVGRLCSGAGLGMAFGAFPLYIGEISMPEIRGALISLATVGAPLGQVVASICGSYLSVSLAAGLYLGLAVLLELLFVWLPESPHHLVKTGKIEVARRSISWYRAGHQVDEELAAVEKFVATDASESLWEKLRAAGASEPIRRAALQIIALFSLMQLSGLNIVMFFMESILVRAGFKLVKPSMLVVLVNVSCTLSAGLSVLLIDRCGRKFLLLLSSTGTTLSMLGLAGHFAIVGDATDTSVELPLGLQLIPAASMFLFMISFFVGLLPVPSAILSEIFPANIKCIAACIAILTGAVSSFLSAKTYQPLLDLVGDTYVFLIYALMSSLILPYTLFAVTETKGKSLQQIQDEFAGKNSVI